MEIKVGGSQKAFGTMNKIFKVRNVSLGVKADVYERAVVSMVMHGEKTWGMTEEESHKLHVKDMTCLRSVRSDQVMNDEVKRAVGVRKKMSDG